MAILNPFKHLWFGASAYFRAIYALFKYRLWPLLIVPGLASLAIFLAVLAASIVLVPLMAEWLVDQTPDWMQWKVFEWLIDLLVFAMLGLVFFLSYKFLILTLLSPALSYIAGVTRERMFPELSSDDLPPKRGEFLRGLTMNLRNLFLEMGWIGLFTLLISWIPVLNVAMPFIAYFFDSYFSGFSLMDSPLESRNMTYEETLKYIKKHRGMALGLGSAFVGLNLIPILGWFLAPSVGAIASTIAVCTSIESAEPQKAENKEA